MTMTTNEARPTADLLSFIADDHAVVIYRPRWNTFTGGMAQTVLLQQIVYWWIKNGRRPFYKFARPCAHRLYRPGDSWEEELSVQRREFENARRDVSARTHGQLDPTALVSYWTDAQRVTWYALNETLLLDRLAALYPPADVGLQLPLPDLMDETSIRSNGRNVHQASTPTEELMDETYSRSNAPNGHLLMDETYIGSNGRNVHPLITENKTTPETTPQTPPSPAAELPAPPPGGGDVSTILRWVGFTDRLNDKERAILDPPTALAWCYFIHLEEAKPTRPKNAVGLARSRWRAGVPPPDDLLALAQSWLALADDGRRALLERVAFAARFGTDDDLDDDFPGLPVAAAIAVYRATAGELAPPSLMPPPADNNRPRSQPSAPSSPPPQPPVANVTLWRDALVELEMQMSRSTFHQWLLGTTATLAGDELTVHVRNHYAVDWLSGRLHDLITRTVTGVAGRPITVRYEVCP